jgi:hypothetical protein
MWCELMVESISGLIFWWSSATAHFNSQGACLSHKIVPCWYLNVPSERWHNTFMSKHSSVGRCTCRRHGGFILRHINVRTGVIQSWQVNPAAFTFIVEAPERWLKNRPYPKKKLAHSQRLMA